ncbi:oligopeptide/dipeptide ABC transporter ATP-binding protein [Halomontanus rarus]|uniref:oligopeptide/dipeptide ABC transporter ATP-binding protein n=1 Tax=Halomontanus rarus TaxID=3034020 RepID=UPI001A992529
MARSADPVVELDNVQVHFNDTGFIDKLRGDETIVHAVEDVSLDIAENEAIALVGESGCGKTTLGKVAVGLQRPTGGTIRYRGQDIWEAKENGRNSEIPYSKIRQSLQIVHQDPGSSLNPNRTVLTSLEVPLKMTQSEMGADAREQRIYQLLEYLGMKPPQDYAHRYPHQLSGGEQQRVALGRALLMSPDVILADEAVSALDVSLRVEMMDLMHDLQEVFNTSFVFISHDFANARYFAGKVGGKIGVMYLGELVEFGPAEEVIRNPQHPYTKVLSWATPTLDPDLAAEESMDPPVRKIDIPDPVNPPSGCRFHTRCPDAREACARESPSLQRGETDSLVSCFRMDDQHEYWNSDPFEGDDDPTEREHAGEQ